MRNKVGNKINQTNAVLVETGIVPSFDPNEKHWCAMIFGFLIYVYLIFGTTYGNAEMIKDIIEGEADSLILIISLVITGLFIIFPSITLCFFFKNKLCH